MVVTSRPAVTSQSLTVPSCPPLTASRPSLLSATPMTPPVWPSSGVLSASPSVFHTFTLPSRPPLISSRPSPLSATPHTWSPRPTMEARQCPPTNPHTPPPPPPPPVRPAAGDPSAVTAQSDSPDATAVTGHASQAFQRVAVPDSDGAILATTCHQPTIRTQRDSRNPAALP